MAHVLPDLPYALDALAPHIDAKTMEIHHGKHHNAYVNNLNKALEGTGLENLPVGKLIADLAQVPEAKRTAVHNNGGGHYNHTLFWSVMGPGAGGAPTGDLADAINGAFGSFANFQEKFTTAAATRFGSGWAWLGVNDDRSLCICSTPNQDSPIMKGIVENPCMPILTLDVWEHAYYLNYQNRRPDYIKAWWHVVNWNAVTDRFKAAVGAGAMA